MNPAEDVRLVVVIGAPRSGTTWVQSMLGAHPRVCTSAELMLFNLYTVPWMRSWEEQCELKEQGGPLGLPLLWSETEFLEYLRGFLRDAYARVLASNPDAEVLVDKHPGYSGHTEHIDRLRPDVRFVHVIRDGRDVVASLLAASRGWGSRWAPSEVEKAAWTWASFAREAGKARRFGDRYMEVRYEDLLENGTEVLRGLFDFVGLPVGRPEAERILREHEFERMKLRGKSAGGTELPDGFFRKGRAGGWEESLTAGMRYRVHLQAGDLLNELGYAEPGWWASSPAVRWTLPPATLLSPSRNRRRRAFRALRDELPEEVIRSLEAQTGPRGFRNRLRRAVRDMSGREGPGPAAGGGRKNGEEKAS